MLLERASAKAPDISYQERVRGKVGLTWEEKYLVQIAFLIARERWDSALQLVERGSAAGRLEYPALRALLGELTLALGPYGMNKLRTFLSQALGEQPEWDPDQDALLAETRQAGVSDEEKAAGSKSLGSKTVHLFRTGMALGLGFGAQAREHLAKAQLAPQQIEQLASWFAYQFGFPFGIEMAES